MGRKPSGNPNGRPKKEVDWEIFESKCQDRCTCAEIAAYFNMHSVTLVAAVKEKYGETFLDVSTRLALSNNCSIRRMRLRHALKNYKACEELCARYLGEQPLINQKDAGEALINAISNLSSIVESLKNGEISQKDLTRKEE